MSGRYKDCKRCQRVRWLMTLVILASMSAVLYFDQFAT